MKTITIDSIDAYNSLYGLPTLHPLVTVADLTKAERMPDDGRFVYGVYALFLKRGCSARSNTDAGAMTIRRERLSVSLLDRSLMS